MDTRLAGKLGGNATLKNKGKKHFKEISKKGLDKRWGKSKEPQNDTERPS